MSANNTSVNRAARAKKRAHKRDHPESDIEEDGPTAPKRQKMVGSVPPRMRTALDDILGESKSIHDRALENGPGAVTEAEVNAILEKRKPDWTAVQEQELKARCDQTARDKDLFKLTAGIENKMHSLWKVCLHQFRETPEFLLSGHLAVKPSEGCYMSNPFYEDLRCLAAQPIWRGQIHLLQGAIGFAVASRTGDTRPFPYSLRGTDSTTLREFRRRNEANSESGSRELPIEALEFALQQHVSLVQDPYITLLQEIHKVSAPAQGAVPPPPDAEDCYVVIKDDLTNVLKAIERSAVNGIPLHSPTSLSEQLVLSQVGHQGFPSKTKLLELMPRSHRRQEFLRLSPREELSLHRAPTPPMDGPRQGPENPPHRPVSPGTALPGADKGTSARDQEDDGTILPPEDDTFVQMDGEEPNAPGEMAEVEPNVEKAVLQSKVHQELAGSSKDAPAHGEQGTGPQDSTRPGKAGPRQHTPVSGEQTDVHQDLTRPREASPPKDISVPERQVEVHPDSAISQTTGNALEPVEKPTPRDTEDESSSEDLDEPTSEDPEPASEDPEQASEDPEPASEDPEEEGELRPFTFEDMARGRFLSRVPHDPMTHSVNPQGAVVSSSDRPRFSANKGKSAAVDGSRRFRHSALGQGRMDHQ